ncbi:MAG: NAD+ synthase [Anaerolineae bacterium]|nr:NAD+ synthase [Anaerolineae bacterium]
MDYVILAQRIIEWMREYTHQAHAQGLVVGLSGGIDSAVTTGLAIHAVGREHVLAALLPCHSQSEDARFAHMAAQALGLDPITIDLSDTYDTLCASLPQGSEMAQANIKPRLRMTTLYYLGQSRNYLVAGTGNKPEIMVGYFTKYGDGGVDLEPLGALYKHEVSELARVLGIPEPLINRPPTAGLWPGQTDEEELGITYAELDSILAAFDAGETPAVASQIVEKVNQMITAAGHKRAMPPVFHIDRENITSYNE